MSVSSINSSNLLSSVLAAAYSDDTREAGPASGAFGSDDTEISSIGALMSSISRMDEDDQSDIKSFLDDLRSSVEDGTFDAETAAAEAPDALQEYADENGIDLADLVQDLADASEGPGVYGPPPPPPDSIEDSNTSLDLSALADMSDDERSEVQDFMESLKTSLEDGTFDAETLAATAPDVLEDLAEENDITISELIQELADEAENAPAPPAPEGSNQYQDSAATGGVGTIFNSEA